MEQILLKIGDNYPFKKAFKIKNDFINKEDTSNISFNLDNNEIIIVDYEIKIGNLLKLEKIKI